MLEEIRYSYTRSEHIGNIFTGIVVAPNPQDGVYIGPIVGRVGLNGHFQGMPNGLIAQALSPDRIALHHYDALSEEAGDDILLHRDGVFQRPAYAMGTGHAGRIQRRHGYLVPQHGGARQQLEASRTLD